jgi:hypothetical protein
LYSLHRLLPILLILPVLVQTASGVLFTATALDNESPSVRLETDHLVCSAPPSVSRETLEASAKKLEKIYTSVTRDLGVPVAAGKMGFTVYPTLEQKGLATGFTLPAHALTGKGQLFSALEPGFEGEVEAVYAGVLVRLILGKPGVEFLETGLAMYFTRGWRGKGYRYWAARIGGLDGAADLDVLLDDHRARAESPLIVQPLAGAFVAFVIEVYGLDTLVEKYPTWQASAYEIKKLDPMWREYLARLRDEFGLARNKKTEIPDFQRGFCHAHEGYQIHNGYISNRSDIALGELAAMGANAVSITPYSYMRNTSEASPFLFARQVGAENDESIIHAVLAAKKSGMAVLLKPHVWIRGGWPGEVEMSTPDEWDRFFEYYWSWIRHYAVLSEMYGVEMLCVGVEFSAASVGFEKSWTEIFERVRGIYGGALTYAANWGDEIESVSFWGELDYIGVNFYYPLSENERPSDAQLLDGVKTALDRISSVSRRYEKRVIVTEVGFTSSPAPWIKPYERDWHSPVDENAQARCYEAFIKGISGRPEYAGVYWWKWPSYLEYGGSRHSGFTPNGKAAKKIVARWFGGIAGP